MSQPTTKAKILRAIEELPEDATIEDAIERLIFLHKVEGGLKQAREGKTAPLDEVEDHLARRGQMKETQQ